MKKIATIAAVVLCVALIGRVAWAEFEDERGGGDDFVPPRVTATLFSIAPSIPAPVPSIVEPEPVITPESTNSAAVTGVSPMATDRATDIPISTPKPTISTEFPWAWLTARAAGVVSFILLTLLSVTGILQTTGVMYRFMSPAASWSLHRAIGSVLLFSVLLHLGTLLLDSFMNLRFVDVLIPFVSPFRTTFVALGIFGFYALLLVLASSLYTLTSHPKFWRTVHFLGFPMFVLILLHGVLIGTDRNTWWMKLVYWTGGVGVTLAVVYRMYWKYHLVPKNGSLISSGKIQKTP